MSNGAVREGLVLDLFAGPGGWSEGMRAWDIRAVGLELDRDACLTRRAAGHIAVRTDVAAYPSDAFRDVWGLVASPPCFPGDTPVLTRRGVVPIASVTPADEVWTHAGRWCAVVRVGRRVAPVVRLKGQGTAGLTVTPEHPIWTRTYKRWRGGDRLWRERWSAPEWTPAANCATKRWAMPVRFARESVEWCVAPWLAGRWVADGWANAARGEVCWAVGHRKRDVFAQRCPAAAVTEQDGCSRFTLCGASAEAEWLISAFGSGAEGKTVPSWLLGAPEDERRSFLDGYLSGDGHSIGPGATKAVTVSRPLACGIRLLAGSLGFDVSEVRNDPHGTKTMPDGREVSQRPWYAITVRQPNPRRPFVKRDGDHAWMTIRRVEPAGECEVFDIEVANDHSYLADGIVVHNCQAFSMAGKREGMKDLAAIHRAVEAARSGWRDELRAGPWADNRSRLILEPLRWAWDVRPEWIACEQVPPAFPVWEHMADVLRGWGYDARAVKLVAADYGVPQTRERAFLLAHRDGVRVPEPTHAKKPEPSLFGRETLPWVSMASALGWVPGGRAMDRRVGGYAADAEPIDDGRPAPTLTLSNGRETWRLRMGNQEHATEREASEPAPAVLFGNRVNEVRWMVRTSFGEPHRGPEAGSPKPEFDPTVTRPATSVQGDPRIGRPGHKDRELGESMFELGAVRITLPEAAVLQSFRADYPFQGTKTSQFRQCGNAVPPLWAEAIIGALSRLAALHPL